MTCLRSASSTSPRLASVLLHCQCPTKIISQCAKRCRSILITELYYPELTGAVCELLPRRRTRPGIPGGASGRISLPAISASSASATHDGNVARAPAHAGAGAHVPDVLGRRLADLARVAEALGGFEVDRDKLAHAALGHGHAEQPAHARHGERVVGDDEKPRVGLAWPSPPSAGRSARHWRRRVARPPRRARRSARGW